MQQLPSMDIWPGGLPLAVTFSFDDGRIQDLRLAGRLNEHGLRATFNIHTAETGLHPDYLSPGDLRDPLFATHEFALHSHTHPFLTSLPDPAVLEEMRENRRRLEEYTGRIVTGAAYPFGDYDARVEKLCAASGASYSRTVDATRRFDSPRPGANWLAWHPTCHEAELTPEQLAEFLDHKMWHRLPRLLFLWGHSWELDGDDGAGWKRIERLAQTLAPHLGRKIWAATNQEIQTFLLARDQLHFSADHRRVHNPSATECWIRLAEEIFSIPAGATISLT